MCLQHIYFSNVLKLRKGQGINYMKFPHFMHHKRRSSHVNVVHVTSKKIM